MSGNAVFFGQAGADPVAGAKIWQLAHGVDDDGIAFGIFGRTNWITPAAGGGSCVFYDAYVTLTWTMEVTLRFKPLLDEMGDTEAWDNGTLDIVTTDIDLDASTTGERLTQTFRIPLMRRVLNADDVEVTRNQLVGTRMRLEVSSVGTLGSGDLILDGAEVEFEQQQDDKPQEGLE